jgi:hypothetical protein
VTCEEGEAGLVDRRLGKASGRRVPVDRAEEVERLYRERYQGFTVKHFHEHPSAASIRPPTTRVSRLRPPRPARFRPDPRRGPRRDPVRWEERQVGADNCVSYRTLKR